MKLKKISADRLTQIANASGGAIQFKTVDNNVTSIVFQGPFGPVFVEVVSYAVTVNELATKKVFKLSFFQKVADENIFIEKDFATEEERENYISRYLDLMPRDELTLAEIEVQDL